MTEEETKETDTNILTYLDILYRRRYYGLIIFLLVITGCLIYSFTAPKLYRTNTIILVERDKIINPLMKGLAVPAEYEDHLKTIQQIILSRSRLETVMKKLDLDLKINTPLEYDLFIDNIRERIDIKKIGNSLYSIFYVGKDPTEAMDVANTIGSLFIEENLETIRGQSQAAYSFIEDQLIVYKKKLEESEGALRLFKEKNLGQLPGEENINLQNLERYQMSLTETQMELKESVLKEGLLRRQLTEEKPMILAFSTNGSESLEGQLVGLELGLTDLLTKYRDKYPEVVKTKAQIDELKKQIKLSKAGGRRDLRTEAMNPLYQQIKEELAKIEIQNNSLQSRGADYIQKVALLENKVRSIPKQEQELTRLTRDYNVNESIYQMLLRKLEEARISKELEVNEKGPKFKVIDYAKLPNYPFKPNRSRVIFMGLILGLGGGVAMIYLLHFLDHSVKDIEEVREYFALPVLAVIPIFDQEEIEKRRHYSDLFIFSASGIYTLAIILLIAYELIKLKRF
ncbi:MAG: XrtA system polysaccharide chain length determinant [bacterium]